MSTTPQAAMNAGSLWNRWDPHIHTPDTILANQFMGANPWEDFLALIEQASPPIRALGITDYWNLDDYQKVRNYKRAGRLSGVQLIFANIELRLDIHTDKNVGINLHLLFSPDDANHVAEIESFLGRLTFSYQGRPYSCNRTGLIALGKAHKPEVVDNASALKVGANQFKISFTDLKEAWDKDVWVQHNCLIAVSGGSNDGTAGLASDDSYQATREEIERFSHIIFASQQKQREFWLGKGVLSGKQVEEKYRGLKPCLHGSDAHTQDRVGAPALQRHCWIKGDVTFESLRQACIEPENRAVVDIMPPSGASPANVISSVKVENASWLPQEAIALNPGLVAVIGARGSGKTALADLIAAGGYALAPHLNSRSFIQRAKDHLTNAKAELTWQSGLMTSGELTAIEWEEQFNEPQVQYLSQQFVDQLCSAEGLDHSLLAEIERVIFNAHSVSDRLGATSFRELLQLRLETSRMERHQADDELREIARELGEERTRKAGLKRLLVQKQEKQTSITNSMKDRDALISKGNVDNAAELNRIREGVETKRAQVGELKQTQRAIRGLHAQAKEYRSRTFPGMLAELKNEWVAAGLTSTEWDNFSLGFKGDIDSLLLTKTSAVEKQIGHAEGPAEPISIMARTEEVELSRSHLPENTDASDASLRLLEKELTRLTRLVGVDAANARKLREISERISREEAEIKGVDTEIARALAADANISELQTRRTAAYEKLLRAIVQEESELKHLYQPLADRLSGESGSLGKLSLYVKRTVDLHRWANRGEELLDLRKGGVFRGKGTLYAAAKGALSDAWRKGTAEEAAMALAAFRDQYDEKLAEHAPMDRNDRDEFIQWGQKIAEWLYSADHISLTYDLQYDGVEIEQLSPGTRGIVLLLLYLAIDGEDTRPLLIDQPEENLDPESVVTELVDRFRDARVRRQIIIITHNANLVVNADADQVIVAQSGAHRAGQLPLIQYTSGGLENPIIRKLVCNILEGGERAFKERAKRLRIRIE